jgi:hypothetical protein
MQGNSIYLPSKGRDALVVLIGQSRWKKLWQSSTENMFVSSAAQTGNYRECEKTLKAAARQTTLLLYEYVERAAKSQLHD